MLTRDEIIDAIAELCKDSRFPDQMMTIVGTAALVLDHFSTDAETIQLSIPVEFFEKILEDETWLLSERSYSVGRLTHRIKTLSKGPYQIIQFIDFPDAVLDAHPSPSEIPGWRYNVQKRSSFVIQALCTESHEKEVFQLFTYYARQSKPTVQKFFMMEISAGLERHWEQQKEAVPKGHSIQDLEMKREHLFKPPEEVMRNLLNKQMNKQK